MIRPSLTQSLRELHLSGLLSGLEMRLARLSHFGPKNCIILQIRPKVSTTNHP